MALNNSKCNHLTPLRFKGLKALSSELCEVKVHELLPKDFIDLLQ